MVQDKSKLQALVGGPLSEGLIAVAHNQPEDGVDFLGQYLLNWVARKEAEAANAAADAQRAADAAREAGKKKAENDKVTAAAAAVDAANATEEELFQFLASSVDTDEMSQRVVDRLSKDIGGGCYIGRKGEGVEGDEPVQQIDYLYANEENKFMVGETLKSAAAGAEGPELNGKGLTWRIWEIQDPEPYQDDAGETITPPPLPREIHCENVMRDPKASFFKFGRLGSYFATLCKYNSSLHADAPEEITMAPAEDGKEPEPVDFSKPVDLFIATDTMGKMGKKFSAAEMAKVNLYSAKLSAGLTRAERAIFEQGVEDRKTQAAENAKLLANVADNSEAIAAELAAMDGLSDEQKALKEQQMKLKAASDQLNALREKLTELERYRVPPKADAVAVLKAALYILKYSKKDLGGEKEDWNKMRRLFNSEFFNRMQACSPTVKAKGIQTYQKVANIKQLLEGKDKAELSQKSVVYGVLFEWCMSFCTAKEIFIEQQSKD
jgi:hypothetical protein